MFLELLFKVGVNQSEFLQRVSDNYCCLTDLELLKVSTQLTIILRNAFKIINSFLIFTFPSCYILNKKINVI